MSTSAPSRAKAIATARPMPLSPPVISAALPSSLPLPTYECSPKSGAVDILDSSPGGCCAGVAKGGCAPAWRGSVMVDPV
jgi:hypothetical protein